LPISKDIPPLDQARLIAEHGSPAKAIRAANADRRAASNRSAVTAQANRTEQTAAAKKAKPVKVYDRSAQIPAADSIFKAVKTLEYAANSERAFWDAVWDLQESPDPYRRWEDILSRAIKALMSIKEGKPLTLEQARSRAKAGA
jgi:hypothetical protein